MGKRGPKPTPTAILKARGSWRAETRGDEPLSGRGIPATPVGMDAAARHLWQRLAPALDRMGVLTVNDGDALGRYCVTLARWKRAMAVLVKRGETFKTRTTAGHPTIKVRPEVAIVKGLSAELLKLEDRFGLSPSARVGLSITAIFNGARTAPTPATKPGDPPAAAGAAAPNVIEGKDRFFKKGPV